MRVFFENVLKQWPRSPACISSHLFLSQWKWVQEEDLFTLPLLIPLIPLNDGARIKRNRSARGY